jgi:HlyD family secretion protein
MPLSFKHKELTKPIKINMHMKKVFKFLLLALLGFIVIMTFVMLYNKSRPKVEIFDVVSPEITTIINKTMATGSVEPRKEIEIKPQVSGIIAEIFVEPGQMVRRNQVLARVTIVPDMVSLNTAESRLSIARLQHENATTTFERQKGLFEKDVISLDDFQRAQLAYNSAIEELKTAENNLELIKKGVTKDSEATTNTLIRSTIDGMVLAVPVKDGFSVIQTNSFNPGTTIAVVADMSDMIFIGNVDETEVGKINEGMPIELTIGAIEAERFDAFLSQIAPKGKMEGGAIQFEIRADIKLRKGQFLRAGYSANADIVLERRDSVLTIIEGLIQFENGSPFVEIETSPQVFEKRDIKTGLSDGINIEVLEGISLEDKIKGRPKVN